MAEYMDKQRFLASMGLTGDETKYGNRNAEHQHRSYSTYMSYEIMDCVEDSLVEEELAHVVHAKWIDGADAFGAKRGQYRVCSRCNICIPFVSELAAPYWRGCPNCLARMDGEQDG